MVPRVPVSRDTRPLHLTLCCHAPPRGIVYWLVSNLKPGLAMRLLLIICTGKDSQMLHNRPWHWTWESCYGANPLHWGFIPWLQGVTGYCICQPLEASQVFKVDTDSRARSYVHFITIWSVVKSHRCCDGDSARGSSQLSMASCYRSQLIDGAHVSRQRLSTAGRGQPALTDVDQTTFLPVGRAAKCGCAERWYSYAGIDSGIKTRKN